MHEKETIQASQALVFWAVAHIEVTHHVTKPIKIAKPINFSNPVRKAGAKEKTRRVDDR